MISTGAEVEVPRDDLAVAFLGDAIVAVGDMGVDRDSLDCEIFLYGDGRSLRGFGVYRISERSGRLEIGSNQFPPPTQSEKHPHP